MEGSEDSSSLPPCPIPTSLQPLPSSLHKSPPLPVPYLGFLDKSLRLWPWQKEVLWEALWSAGRVGVGPSELETHQSPASGNFHPPITPLPPGAGNTDVMAGDKEVLSVTPGPAFCCASPLHGLGFIQPLCPETQSRQSATSQGCSES